MARQLNNKVQVPMFLLKMLENQLKIGGVFQGNYVVQSKNLSKTAGGRILQVLNQLEERKETLKVDLEKTFRIQAECKVLEQVQEFASFPRTFMSNFSDFPNFFTEEYHAVTVNLLIKDLKMFDLNSTISIFSHLISAISNLHGKGIIHGNICPRNIAVTEKNPKIKLIGFNTAVDTKLKSCVHLDYKNEISCSFASISAHNGIRKAKDDLESLGYLLVYTLIGKLPWKGQFPKKSFNKWQKVFIIKSSKTIKDLCEGCPAEFEEYLSYVKRLQNGQNPDYEYLKSLIVNIIPSTCINKFMWTSHRKKKITKKKHHKLTKMQSEKPKMLKTPLNVRSKTGNVTENIEACYLPTLISDELPEFKDRKAMINERNLFEAEKPADKSGELGKKCIVM